MDESPNEPKEVQEVFDWYRLNFGFVPNLSKVLSASPASLRAFRRTELKMRSFVPKGFLSSGEFRPFSNKSMGFTRRIAPWPRLS